MQSRGPRLKDCRGDEQGIEPFRGDSLLVIPNLYQSRKTMDPLRLPETRGDRDIQGQAKNRKSPVTNKVIEPQE